MRTVQDLARPPAADVETSAVLQRVCISIDVAIRRATENDLPALEWLGLFSEHRSIIRNAFDAQERGDGLMLLAVSNGFPIGQVWIDFQARRAENTALLWAVRTFHPLQKNGIGRALMQSAERELARRDIRRAELTVETWNEDALHFYEKLGWRQVARGFAEAQNTGAEVWTLAKQAAEHA